VGRRTRCSGAIEVQQRMAPARGNWPVPVPVLCEWICYCGRHSGHVTVASIIRIHYRRGHMQKSRCRVPAPGESASELSPVLSTRCGEASAVTWCRLVLAIPSALPALPCPLLNPPPDGPMLAHATKKKSFPPHCRGSTAARMTTALFLALNLGAAELAARPVVCTDLPTHVCCNSRFRTPGDDHYAIGQRGFFLAIEARSALTPCFCGCPDALWLKMAGHDLSAV
jgi:hypothetical protein